MEEASPEVNQSASGRAIAIVTIAPTESTMYVFMS